MKSINITYAKNKFYKLVLDVNAGLGQIKIVNNKGKNAVLISESEWKNIEETLFLSNIPGYVENIKKIKNSEDWNTALEYKRDEEW